MTRWVCEFTQQYKVDVLRNRKAFAYDCEDIDEALSLIKRDRRYRKGDKIEAVEPDGYRRQIRVL
jgi:hypothetical protein